MPYDEKLLNKVFEDVKQKVENSSKKYNDNAYMLADIPKEIYEELIDIIGWPTLEVLRILELFQGKVAKIEDIYWKNFFPRQTDEFLKDLLIMSLVEIQKRNKENWKDTSGNIIKIINEL